MAYERKYEYRFRNHCIDPEVIAKYAGTVAVECFGIVGMAAVSMKDGLVKLLKKESLTRGNPCKSLMRIRLHLTST